MPRQKPIHLPRLHADERSGAASVNVRALLLLCAMIMAGAHLEASAAEPAAKTVVPGEMERADRRFFEHAVQIGLAEVAMAQLAQERAKDAEVKSFAAMMASEHGASNAELRTLADSKGVQLATQLDGAQAKILKKLGESKPDDFDREYVEANVAIHKAAILLFKHTAGFTDDPDVKTFAIKMLPALEKHRAAVAGLRSRYR